MTKPKKKAVARGPRKSRYSNLRSPTRIATGMSARKAAAGAETKLTLSQEAFLQELLTIFPEEFSETVRQMVLPRITPKGVRTGLGIEISFHAFLTRRKNLAQIAHGQGIIPTPWGMEAELGTAGSGSSNVAGLRQLA